MESGWSLSIGKAPEDAQASMDSFMTADAAKGFMAKVDASSMIMKRYEK